MTRSVLRQQQQQSQQQAIIINSHGYDTSSNARPLELHRHVFAKGHQSTKALEFVLWFLFSRLDKGQARDRFKECWPVLDRHDAREFRNVAYKWLEELRKDGCFGVGHQLSRNNDAVAAAAVAVSSGNNNSSNAGGLGLFLPTIRRSYLDESIGERIEQLVLVLSTFVLSTVVKQEQPHGDGRTLWELVSRVPDSVQDEASLLESIDSQIVRRSRSFLQDIERQKSIRADWSLKSQDMSSRLNAFFSELTNLESERRMFLVHQPHIADRTGLLSLEELRILEDRWIEKINDQWRPILNFVERHVGRKDLLQALLDADSGNGSSVLDGKRLQKDLSMTLGHLASHNNPNSNEVDLVSILRTWKRSLLHLESGAKQGRDDSEASAATSRSSLEALSRNHTRQLETIKGTRTRLEHRLQEVTQRVERLKREKKIQERPYRRLLSTIVSTEGHGSELSSTSSLPAPEDIRKEAAAATRSVFSALAPSSTYSMASSPSTRQGDIRNQIRASVSQPQDNQASSRRSLLESCRGQDISDVLLVRPPCITVPKPTRSPLRLPRTEAFKIPSTTIKSTTTTKATTTATAIPSALPPARMSSSVIKPPSSFVLSRNGLAGSTSSIEFPRKRSLSKGSSIKPVPEDLVVQENRARSQSYESVCSDIINLLAEDTTAADTPPITLESNKRPARPLLKSPQRATAPPIAPTNRRTALWTSLFRGRDTVSKTGAKSQVSVETVKPVDSASCQPAHTVANAVSDHTKPIPMTQEPTHTPPAIPPARSMFRDRLGVSRKRRQSSDFQPGRSTTPLLTTPDVPQETFAWEKDVAVQPTKIDSLFQESDDEPPGTPSKRRRIGSLLDRRTSFGFDAEIPTKEDVVIKPTKPLSRTPDRNTMIKILRSPKLTLEDLRAPTPKPVKIKDGEPISMPLMLLHTPQQKLLFQMEAGLIPKVPNPFTTLTPSSTTDSKGKSLLMSPNSPFKRPAFASSIFSRFNSDPAGQDKLEDRSGMDLRKQSPPRSLWDLSSPFAPSPTPVKTTRTPPAAPVRTGSKDKKPLTTTSILNHLLNGNSVVLDRVCNKTGSGSVDKSVSDVTSSTRVTLPNQTERQEHKETRSVHQPVTRSVETKPTHVVVMKATVPAVTDENAAVVSLKVKQNPWGRPPSWKPKSPRMIDMDKKRHAERTQRLAAKGAGIPAPVFDSLAKSSLGSLKVSVFGRPKNGAVPSSSSFVSHSSLSSLSSRSFRSDSSLPSSLSGPGNAAMTQGQGMVGEDIVVAEDDDDDPDNDAREFSPPPVSPIRGSDSEIYKSFADSMMMSTRAESEQPKFNIPTRSVQPRAAASVVVDRPVELSVVESIEAESLEQQQQREAERRRYLDEPMPEYEGGEDETVLNYALQPIFGGGGGGQGSFRKSLPMSMPRSFGNSSSNSKESGDLPVVGRRLSHGDGQTIGRVSGRVGRSEEEEENGGREEEEAGEAGEGDGMLQIGGLFDEVMPEGLDPHEALWEITELFS
ncbi:hypothetical protein BGX33_012618 [Mortierella sp. NVP41]|nr:hypothetical protein BGX33_012618 [Mortierella sp. NVP41]